MNDKVYSVIRIMHYGENEEKMVCCKINDINWAVRIANHEKGFLGKQEDVIIEDEVGNEIWTW